MDISLTNQHLTRQLDIIPISTLGETIHIIGAGAIGSLTALSLAKMGFTNLFVYDDDHVDVENMNCQFYRFSDIGKPKVVALAELIKDFTGTIIEPINRRYNGEGPLKGIVISAVDSMKVRKTVWDAHCGVAPTTKAIIDPRMAAEEALLYTMNPMSVTDKTSYEATLYTDENAVRERCTAKSTMYTAQLLSGLVAKSVKDIVTKSSYPRIVMWSIKDNQFIAHAGKNIN